MAHDARLAQLADFESWAGAVDASLGRLSDLESQSADLEGRTASLNAKLPRLTKSLKTLKELVVLKQYTPKGSLETVIAASVDTAVSSRLDLMASSSNLKK